MISRCATRVVRRSRSPADLLLVHRLLSLVPLPGYDPPRRVDVYDFDDALFATPNSATRGGFAALKREGPRCNAYLRRARLVLAGNEYLATYARGHAKRVEIMPSCIDPDAHAPRAHRDVRSSPSDGWARRVRRHICSTSCRPCARSTAAASG